MKPLESYLEWRSAYVDAPALLDGTTMTVGMTNEQPELEIRPLTHANFDALAGVVRRGR